MRKILALLLVAGLMVLQTHTLETQTDSAQMDGEYLSLLDQEVSRPWHYQLEDGTDEASLEELESCGEDEANITQQLATLAERHDDDDDRVPSDEDILERKVNVLWAHLHCLRKCGDNCRCKAHCNKRYGLSTSNINPLGQNSSG